MATRDRESFHHRRILQLMPLTGAYYAVWATEHKDDEPAYFSQAVPALALVEEWDNDTYAQSHPQPDDDVERVVHAVCWMDSYFDLLEDDNLLGFYWAEDLRNPDVIQSLKASAAEHQEYRAARLQRTKTAGPAVSG